MPNHLSGCRGKIAYGASDFSSIKNFNWTPEANVPEFGHSGSSCHKVTVGGTKRGDLTFDAVLDTDDPIYDRIKVGQLVTLDVYEDATRNWVIPCRIKTMAEDVDIDDGGEESIAITAVAHGPWTYPDGTVSS